ncbi:MAG: hypothetical protein A2087_06840 [Spirochaetes bacterium GWD1_61_31]|nr:MAG: hypothetical protein A2Y37_08630 [Spirochaetes bacterium GWB1_60_80]OHD31839.1 MAG: hypothetical protein A2004_10005 [Spirochaetes bacterium GWC1_61_12]OHD40065.1 MAG: hypothetical protein A2087_06840 [Spirochaetes bacterium GWD1_61_31]OHD45886.1 MAG: hypothetical protein A2Y35_04265 [Spirochaetes bacterium GWE1_60_18]OHD58430.1 MAG: hypothetical protein A2Y32_06655 [Spirochaetes bacterium GWF1_60_12]HAW85412.1 SAM-dependent methyltransferase [Spirochaetaceae bacterium]
METFESFVERIFGGDLLINAVISGQHRKDAAATTKINIRRVCTGGSYFYQCESLRQQQSFHENLPGAAAAAKTLAWLKEDFRQGMFFCADADYQWLVSKKGVFSCVRKAASRPDATPDHNRKKQYLLPEGQAVPWMVDAGIMRADGSIVKSSYHKFRQVNRYLEFIEDVLPQLPTGRPLRIVDFGCGKAALSFALYDWLTTHQKRQAVISGLDLKADVIKQCAAQARKLGFDGLSFAQGDIAGWQLAEQPDMVICLHACNTATDAALARAVAWQTEVILAVPCCHKELIQAIKVDGLAPMLQYGLLRDRFGAMATDTLRALALEVMGYKTQICEFIDMEHTPKNILIRAVRQSAAATDTAMPAIQAAARRYLAFRAALGVQPWLESALGPEFASRLATVAVPTDVPAAQPGQS